MNKFLTFIKYLAGFIIAFYLVKYGFHFIVKVGVFFFYIGVTLIGIGGCFIFYHIVSISSKVQNKLKRKR